MFEYLKEHGIFDGGGDIVRINGDLTYSVDAKPYRRTGIRMTGREDTGWRAYETWDIIITPKEAVIKTVSVDDGWKDERVEKIRTIQIVGAP